MTFASLKQTVMGVFHCSLLTQQLKKVIISRFINKYDGLVNLYRPDTEAKMVFWILSIETLQIQQIKGTINPQNKHAYLILTCLLCCLTLRCQV